LLLAKSNVINFVLIGGKSDMILLSRKNQLICGESDIKHAK